MKKLTLCYVSFNYYPSQGLIAFLEYSQKISELGHKVIVIAAGRENEHNYEVLNGVTIFRIKIKSTKRKSLDVLKFSILANRLLLKIIRIYKIQIIHVFSWTFSPIVKLNIFEQKIKWIYDIRSGPLEKSSKRTIFYKIIKLLIYFETLFFDHLFIIDTKVKDEILKNHNLKKINISPLGVDLNKFNIKEKNLLIREQNNIMSDDYLIIYIGSLNKVRCINNLIDGFYLASKKINNLKMFLIGEGNDIKNLIQYSIQLSINKKILFLGYIPHDKIPKYLAAADIAISYIPKIPSFNAQPPAKTIEYLASSLPVIATNTEGNKQFINNGENGLLIEDSPKAIANALILLCSDADLRIKISKNARESILKYDWRKIVLNILIPSYEEVLKN